MYLNKESGENGEAMPMMLDTHAKAFEAFKQECGARTAQWRAENPNARF